MEISLEGKRAFVTAGGDGMGRTTAVTMDRLGAKVFTCDIDPAGLATLPDSITTWECDVADSDALDAIFDEILPGGLDIMINNAGVGGPTKLVEDVTNEEWDHCMGVCVDAQFYCARRVAPVFKAQKSGVLINMVSAAGIMGFPGRSPYVAAKYAVAGFTETLAMELGPDNIRVNGIVPGNVNGERMERVIAGHAALEGIDPEEVRRLYAIGTSMQCYVDPQEISDLIMFLVSDYGRHISGQVIGVDGNTETLWIRS
ncbi:MAG: SDR family oxidoreductase [Acidimicrobiales bacterium]